MPSLPATLGRTTLQRLTCMPSLYFGWLLTRSPPSACAVRNRCDVWRGTPRGRPKRHAQTIRHQRAGTRPAPASRDDAEFSWAKLEGCYSAQSSPSRGEGSRTPRSPLVSNSPAAGRLLHVLRDVPCPFLSPDSLLLPSTHLLSLFFHACALLDGDPNVYAMHIAAR